MDFEGPGGDEQTEILRVLQDFVSFGAAAQEGISLSLREYYLGTTVILCASDTNFPHRMPLWTNFYRPRNYFRLKDKINAPFIKSSRLL